MPGAESGKYETVLQQAALACMTVNLDHLVDSVNPFALKLLGLEMGEIIGRPISEIFPDLTELEHGKAIKSITGFGERKAFILVMNEIHWKEETFFNVLVLDPPKLPGSDAQAIQFGHLLEHSLNEILIFEKESLLVLETNRNCTMNLGWTRAEALNKKIDEIILLPQGSSMPELVESLYKGEDSHLMMGGFVKRKDASQYPVNLRLQKLDFYGKHAVAAIFEDLSWKQEIQHDLGESRDRLSAIFDTAIDGIIVINERGVIEMANPSAGSLFGYENSELIGQKINMLMPEPDQSNHDKYMSNYYHSGQAKIIGIGREVVGKKKNGTLFPFRLSISEVKIQGKRAFTGLIHDISDVKKAEEKLRRYARDLERSNKELENFAYISSHDLQEPLRKIRAFGDRLMLKEADALSEKGQDYLNRMINAAERMQRLIDDLLTFSRLTTRAKPFELVDLNEVLLGVLSDLELYIEKNNAQIRYSKLPQIEGEATQIRQLFQNLISNAIKFTEPGKDPIVEISYEIWSPKPEESVREGEQFIRILVKDNGIGFEEKYSGKIFQIFQRLRGNDYEGSGIGLAICKKITDRHGGSISVESEPGTGTQFLITLPVKHNQHKTKHTESNG